jgi:mono/diheme cytochrome c family protein
MLLLAGLAASAGEAKPWPVPRGARERKNPVAATAASLREGGRLYRELCLICHGEKGDGNGPWSERMATKPWDFTDARKMRAVTDGELFWRMSKGRELMPGFEKQLNERQRWTLVNYLRTLSAAPPADGPAR